MKPVDFPQANKVYGPPPGFAESQVVPIPALEFVAQGGSCDDTPFVVVAWQPSKLELWRLLHGHPVFITMMGGLAPHFLTTDIEEAKRPA